MTVVKPPAATGTPPPAAWRVALFTALAYALTGSLALALAIPPGYASPLYPSAGIALAAALVYGRPGLLGAALGAFAVNAGLGAMRGTVDMAMLTLPLVISVGAALQAAAGAALVRRYVSQPLTLTEPRDILRFSALGAGLACIISAGLATVSLWIAGAIGADQMPTTVWTWWVGDTLGVLIGAPLTLTLIGRPRADWLPRRRTVGLPLLLATALLALASAAVVRWDEDRLRATFLRDAQALSGEMETRLATPVHALQALRGAYLARGDLTATSVHDAAAWWLRQPPSLQAMGHSVRLAAADVAAFEAEARRQGLSAFRVFDRESGAPAPAGADKVVVRLIEPAAGNQGALGVNAMSIPAARAAIEQTRGSGEPAATEGFRLTQSASDETGVVLYQALYRGAQGTAAERLAHFSGVVFVTMRAGSTLGMQIKPELAYLGWCVIDLAPGTPRPRLAGPAGCESAQPAGFTTRRQLDFAGRSWELRVSALPASVPGLRQSNAWLYSVTGLLAAAILGALLLTVTGRTRRIEAAVLDRTADLQREVAERRHAEDALRDSEARQRSIVDNVPIGVMFLDARGFLIEANPRLCEMLGRPAEALRLCTLADISHPGEAAENRRQMLELLSGRSTLTERQMRLLSADGSAFPARVRMTVLRDGHGQAQRLAGVVEDITEHLRLEASEQARHRAEEANRTKNEFVSRMSHELRTPLNAIIGFAQLLGMERESAGLTVPQRDWAAQIQRAGWHLLEMINETLDLARIESGMVQLALRPLDLGPLLAHCVAMVAGATRQRAVSVTVDLGADAQAVLADETRLTQVLINLLSNAVKYNREGGTVRVHSRRLGDGQIELTVHDSGIGMTPQQLSGLFQPYNRLGREHTAIEGTGIGLVISRRLAELMGGSLDAESSAGSGSDGRGGDHADSNAASGSAFTLRLPAAPPGPQAKLPVAPSAALPPYRQRDVLYIEDNETNVEVMRGILAQRPQIAMRVAMLGLDGLSALREQRPDLILLDMQLPDISGLELLRHLKQDDDSADIPVMVVSADATTASIEAALTLGAAHYVTKPVDLRRFLQTLDELLENIDTRWG